MKEYFRDGQQKDITEDSELEDNIQRNILKEIDGQDELEKDTENWLEKETELYSEIVEIIH